MYIYPVGRLQTPEPLKNKLWRLSKTNSISPVEECDLINRCIKFNCKKSYNKLYFSHIKIVNKFALKFSKSFNDLFYELQGEGFKGLSHAIQKIDPKKARLSTYAPFWISYYIETYFLQNNFGNISMGVSSVEKKIFYYLRNLKIDHKELSEDEIIKIAKKNKVKTNLVKDILSFVSVRNKENKQKDLSQNFENSSSSRTILDNLAYEMNINHNSYDETDKNIDLDKYMRKIKSWLSCINSRDRRIFEKKHLMEKTYNEIAKEEKISFQRVSQIDKKNFNELKKYMMDYNYAA